MSDTNTEREYTAYHEAGHALANILLGGDVEHVSIEPRGQGNLGFCRRTPPADPEAEIVTCYAGTVAEARRRDTDPFPQANPTDHLQAVRLATAQCPQRAGRDALLSRAWCRAVRLFDGLRERRGLHAIADALLQHGTLDGDDVRSLWAATAGPDLLTLLASLTAGERLRRRLPGHLGGFVGCGSSQTGSRPM